MKQVLIRIILLLIAALFPLNGYSFALKDLFSIEKLKILNYLDVNKTPSNGGWLRSVTVKIPTQLDIAGLATSQIPFLNVSSNKEGQVTFVSWFQTEKEADNLLSFVDYLNKIPYDSKQIINNFEIGEEIRFKTQLSFLTGVSSLPKLLITPMALEGNTILTGEFIVYIKKINATEVEVSFTNSNDQEKGVKGNIGTNTNLKFINVDSHLNVSFKKLFPRLLDFSNADNSTYSRTFSYKVDLASEEGNSFYNKLLGSALIAEDLKSLIDKKNYNLAQIQKLFIDPLDENNKGITSINFGSLKNTQFHQRFNLGWLFKNSNSQKYRRLWYQYRDTYNQEHFYLVDEFSLVKAKEFLFGLGTQFNESRIARAFYTSDEHGKPIDFLELQLSNSLSLKTKKSSSFIGSWEKMLKNNFRNEATDELIDIINIANKKKQTLKADVKFTIRDNFFILLKEKYFTTGTSNQTAKKEIKMALSRYLDSLENLDVFTANSCIGKICDILSKNKKSNSQLYANELTGITEALLDLLNETNSIAEKSKILVNLKKNALFTAIPIGLMMSLLPEKDYAKAFNYTLSAENETENTKKTLTQGLLKNYLTKNIMETVQYLQGELLRPSVLNKCLLYY
jgi:hypothetical protein